MTRFIPLVLATIVAIFLIAPILIIVPMSFSTAISFEFPPPGYWLGYYVRYFHSDAWLAATANSFIIAFGSMVLTMLVALPAAFGYVRYRFFGKNAFNLIIMLPLIVPGVVSALGYYGFLSRIHLVGTRPGMMIAHSALSVPVAFLAITAALKGFDRNLERAANSAGAGPLPHLLVGDAAGASPRHSGRRTVRLPALVQRGRGGDLHRRPRCLDAAEENVREHPARIRSGARGGVHAADGSRARRRADLDFRTAKDGACDLILS